MPAVEKPVAKRKKPLSCAECRRLKLKCELVFPCAHCVKRGLASICPEGELVNGSRRTKILASTEDLHKRIAALEEALKVATSSRHPLLEDSLYANRKEIKSRSPPLQTPNPGTSSPPDSLPSVSHLTLNENDPHRSRYYGAAGSVYLSKHVKQEPPETSPVGSSNQYDLASSLDYSDFFPPYTGLRPDIKDIIANYLPPPEVTISLADTYYRTYGWVTNIVQRDIWDHNLFPYLYQDPALVRPQHLALSLLVLSVGALMDLSRPPHNDLARNCFNGARACLSLDPSHSMTFCQCIYLYGTYIMNGGTQTTGGDAFWPLLRMAMGICESIGLHRDGSLWNLDGVMERRIVFWEIHGLDVLQSVSLGRGQCISDWNIDVQIPFANDDTGYHYRSYILTKIWSQINEKQVRIKPWIYSEVHEIDRQISAFQDDLPYHLSPVVPPSPDDLTDPIKHKEAYQRNMLLLYINEARLTLHRGWCIRALRESPIEPLSSPLKQSYLTCLEACRAIISLVRNMVVLQGQLIHRRWHFFFHLFGACVCLAAAVIRAPASSLARTILAELESGVALFKMTDREELVTVDRLRDKAVRALHNAGRLPDDQDHEGEGETEDLDLLGAGVTITRTGTTTTTTTMPNVSRSGFKSDLFTQPLHLPLVDQIDTNTADFSNQEFTDVMSNIVDEQNLNSVNWEWNDFDMDAFLHEIGVL
ncbi:uncharacterized protein IL334_007476 [Kwoniella shivajii]|uniref:Zn(2)-C6 fungal-type domain-containing protein n=1 Tax=Kwoniella shivajii TaxID=564305 RepID=A0ABZ1D8R9_9TREE|nr:hypothetical protein IL334_007476 [Kwoniella shivajii]